MLDGDAARLLAAVANRPGDLASWLDLAKLAGRSEGVRRGLDAASLSPGLAAALAAHPGERALAAFLLSLHGLAPMADAGMAGTGWDDAGRRAAHPTGDHDAATGLPLAARRMRDLALVLLVPAVPVASEPDEPWGVTAGTRAVYLDRAPVAVDAYRTFVDEEGAPEPFEWSRQLARPTRPVVGVTLAEAHAYATWVRGRLPAAREWRMAAYSTDGRRYPWGDARPTDAHAVYRREWTDTRLWDEALVPAGERPEGLGPFGHADLAGLVWEWMNDPDDPEGWREGEERRMTLGGSFSSEGRDLEPGVSSWPSPTGRFGDVGFRVATPIG